MSYSFTGPRLTTERVLELAESAIEEQERPSAADVDLVALAKEQLDSGSVVPSTRDKLIRLVRKAGKMPGSYSERVPREDGTLPPTVATKESLDGYASVVASAKQALTRRPPLPRYK